MVHLGCQSPSSDDVFPSFFLCPWPLPYEKFLLDRRDLPQHPQEGVVSCLESTGNPKTKTNECNTETTLKSLYYEQFDYEYQYEIEVCWVSVRVGNDLMRKQRQLLIAYYRGTLPCQKLVIHILPLFSWYSAFAITLTAWTARSFRRVLAVVIVAPPCSSKAFFAIPRFPPPPRIIVCIFNDTGVLIATVLVLFQYGMPYGDRNPPLLVLTGVQS